MMTFRVENIAPSDRWPAVIGRVGESFSYIITNGSSKIVGYRIGSLNEVTTYVDNYVQQLNARLNASKKNWVAQSSCYKPCFTHDILTSRRR